MLRLYLPLIEPDGRFSRIRLSDKDSCVRTQKTTPEVTQIDQAQVLSQLLVRELFQA